jgi:DNA polymerase-3 subunit epsilon
MDVPSGTYKFIALDVETASRASGSICQIGIACVADDGDITTFGILVDPEVGFAEFNIELHGIGPDTVHGAATFPEAWALLAPLLTRHTLIQHSSFDERAIGEACVRYGMDIPAITWLDSVRIARAAWPEFRGNGGHGLGHLKDALGLDFQHHDAEEDAKAAAQVVVLAEEKTGKPFNVITAPTKKPKPRKANKSVAANGDPYGPLAGQVAVFTGPLSITRKRAATMAAAKGMSVVPQLDGTVTVLVVGDPHPDLLIEPSPSRKYLAAIARVEAGQDIKIIGEQAFLAMVR